MAFLSGFFSKEKKESLDQGLEKSKESFFGKLTKAIAGKSVVDEDVLDSLEEILISSDVGVDTTLKIIGRIQDRVARDKYLGTSELDRILKEEIASLLSENNSRDLADFEIPAGIKPYVLMVVGVNGVGKTTTIGKLAAQYKKRGNLVVLGAADTFRAAAVEQLKLWGERIGVQVVARGMNTDPSSVAFDTVKQGVEMGADVIIIDTAGRLHTKINLMAELSKIKRVMEKIIPDAPHDVMLVLDGSTGQNAVVQAREFTKATDVSCLAITKLDGTARGGVVIGISDMFKIPVKYIGVGEKVDDLQVFNKVEFVDSLFRKK
jgi:fused signal recognition particle receptor